MYNPITKNRAYLIAYFLFWILIAALQTMLLHWAGEVSWEDAVIDALVFSLCFGLTGLGIWFVVRFTSLEAKNMWNILLNHTAAASLLIFVWLGISYVITSFFIERTFDLREVPISELSWRVALGLVFYTMVSLNYYLLIYYQNFREKLVGELEMKSLLKESELSMLKAQLNPHFIFNSLNSISALTLTRPEDAHEMIVKLSTFLRYTIGNEEAELVTVKKEIETVKLYLEIEKSRFGDKLEIQVNGLETIPENFKVPNLILQPLVENAIKFGVYESLEKSTIVLNLLQGENVLIIEIINSCGERATGRPGKGIGLKNVAGRLLHLYDEEGLLKAEKLPKGFFKVQVKIPQRKKHE